MNYDAFMPEDMDMELAYDGMYYPYYPPFDGYYDPRYFRDFRYRRVHPRHHRFRHHRRYW